MRTRRTWLGTLLSVPAAGAAGALLVATPAAAQTSTLLTRPVTGTFTDALGGVGTFAGTFTLQRFTTQNGALAAVGTLVGTLTNSLGAVVGTVSQQVTLPALADATCQILHLELGPLDLNLLGLVVHLDRVVLDITAQSGPGNLLGNLLCGVAGLLDSGGALTGIVNVLNQILRLLR